MSLSNEVIVLFAGTRGFADKIPLERVKAWETALLRYMESSHPGIGKDIAAKKRITEENEASLREAITAFNATWQ
jgi:F-type H+-transporting ATPase subunit alpha